MQSIIPIPDRFCQQNGPALLLYIRHKCSVVRRIYVPCLEIGFLLCQFKGKYKTSKVVCLVKERRRNTIYSMYISLRFTSASFI